MRLIMDSEVQERNFRAAQTKGKNFKNDLLSSQYPFKIRSFGSKASITK